MNPKQQQRVIATACGHKFEIKTICPYCKGNTPYECGDDYGITLYAECSTCDNTGEVEPYHTYIPDYVNSLDAMHEAEKFLTMPEWPRYLAELNGYSNVDEWWADLTDLDKLDAMRKVTSSSASERAEAFLKVKNLWKE